MTEEIIMFNKSDVESLEEAIKRLERENKALQAYKDVNEDFKKAWGELNKKYTEVLNLAKLNADSNEYCLKKLEKKNFALTQESQQKSQTICELEQENKELKKRLDSYAISATVPTVMYNECERERCKYGSALEEIREICKCSKSPINCDECPQNDDCEELCVNDENLQDIIYDKITGVLQCE